MDPIGLSVENFDAVGRWRTRGEGDEAVDASGALPSGVIFEGAAGLKKAFQAESNSPMQFIVAREIYKHLERIADAFEDVANEIDGIVIDHA